MGICFGKEDQDTELNSANFIEYICPLRLGWVPSTSRVRGQLFIQESFHPGLRCIWLWGGACWGLVIQGTPSGIEMPQELPVLEKLPQRPMLHRTFSSHPQVSNWGVRVVCTAPDMFGQICLAPSPRSGNAEGGN